jgi:hypothetical protein
MRAQHNHEHEQEGLMVWGRMDDKAGGNPKLRAITKSARGALMMLWAYCAEQPTSGWLPDWKVAAECSAAELTQLTTIKAHGRAPLLHAYTPGEPAPCECMPLEEYAPELPGYWVHDWLVHNPGRSEVAVHKAKRRELNDMDLRHSVKRRDGNACRYCAVIVPWADNRSPKALAIDHLDPTVAAGLHNLVVACTACNSRKKDAVHPAAAGLTLLPPPVEVPVSGAWDHKTVDPAAITRAWPTGEALADLLAHGPDWLPDLVLDAAAATPAACEDCEGRGVVLIDEHDRRQGEHDCPDCEGTGTRPTTPEPADPTAQHRPIGTAIGNRSDRRSPHDRSDAPTTEDRSAQDQDQHGDPTGSEPAGGTGDVLPPGTGRDGSGTAQPRVLRATTPRTAANPPTYRKSATSNPPPASRRSSPPPDHTPPTQATDTEGPRR